MRNYIALELPLYRCFDSTTEIIEFDTVSYPANDVLINITHLYNPESCEIETVPESDRGINSVARIEHGVCYVNASNRENSVLRRNAARNQSNPDFANDGVDKIMDVCESPSQMRSNSRFLYAFALTFFLSFIIRTPMVAWAQSFAGYEQHALAGAAVALTAPSFSLSINPASLSGDQLDWYGTQHFGMGDLKEGGLAFTKSMDRSLSPELSIIGTGIQLHHFGFDLYQNTEMMAGVSLGTGNASFGTALGASHTSIQDYGSATTGFLNVGFSYLLRDNWHIGGVVRYIPLLSTGDFLHGLPTQVAAGIYYSPTNRLELLIAGEQEFGFEHQLKVAANYAVISQAWLGSIYIGGGYSTVTEEWTTGMRYSGTTISAVYTLRDHPVLGWSHGVGFGYNW
ncbi:MAG: hypothetical protein LAT57_11320 [Balneolales bacterium]|nr:hypothetical protein [Balneolales bacterium]